MVETKKSSKWGIIKPADFIEQQKFFNSLTRIQLSKLRGNNMILLPFLLRNYQLGFTFWNIKFVTFYFSGGGGVCLRKIGHLKEQIYFWLQQIKIVKRHLNVSSMKINVKTNWFSPIINVNHLLGDSNKCHQIKVHLSVSFKENYNIHLIFFQIVNQSCMKKMKRDILLF